MTFTYREIRVEEIRINQTIYPPKSYTEIQGPRHFLRVFKNLTNGRLSY